MPLQFGRKLSPGEMVMKVKIMEAVVVIKDVNDD